MISACPRSTSRMSRSGKPDLDVRVSKDEGDTRTMRLARRCRNSRRSPHTLSCDFRARETERPHVRSSRRRAAGAHPVRLYRQLPFHFSGLLHRPCELSRRAGGAVAMDRQGAVFRPVQILAENFRRHVRHGRRVGHRHVLSVRHQLVGLLRQGRAGHRPADGLRGADRFLSRSGLSRRHAVWPVARRQGPAFFCDFDGGDRHVHLRVLDSLGE